MTRLKIKRVRAFITAVIIASTLLIASVTALYYWKGLGDLKSKDDPSRSYYIHY